MAIKQHETFGGFLSTVLQLGGSTDCQTSASGRSPHGGLQKTSNLTAVHIYAVTYDGDCHHSPARDWSDPGDFRRDCTTLAQEGAITFNSATTSEREAARKVLNGLTFNLARIGSIAGKGFSVVGKDDTLTVNLKFTSGQVITAWIRHHPHAHTDRHGAGNCDEAIYYAGRLRMWHVLNMDSALTATELAELCEQQACWLAKPEE